MSHIPTLTPYGDAAILVHYDTDGYDPDVIHAVQSLAETLRKTGPWGDIVPAYDSVLVSFNPTQINQDTALRHITRACDTVKTQTPHMGKIIDIPVYYGGADGPDMAAIMARSGLSEAEVIDHHSRTTYRVCMMGFIPGFTFLSATPKALHHPRHAKPRAKVPAGSIGIAGWQTGIYGLSSPGGWQIIGRTDTVIFDAKRDTPFLIEAGDSVRFVPLQRSSL